MTIQIVIFQSIYSAHKNNFLVSNFPMQQTSFAVFSGHLQTMWSFPKATLDAATHWHHFIVPTAFYCQKNCAILGGFHCIYTSVENKQWRKGCPCSRPWSADILWSTDIGNLSKMTATDTQSIDEFGASSHERIGTPNAPALQCVPVETSPFHWVLFNVSTCGSSRTSDIAYAGTRKHFGYMEGPRHHFCKHVCFLFAYYLRIRRDKTLILYFCSV